MKKACVFNDQTKKSLPNYGLKSTNGVVDMHLYQFYCSLVVNDFESVKKIADTHNLDWESTLRQPHPVSEYLNKVDVVREDIFEWLLAKFGPSYKIRLEWERNSIPPGHLRAIRQLIPLQPRISGNLFTQYIEVDPPASNTQMDHLLKCWDGSASRAVWAFIFDTYPKICIQRRLITEEKMMTLLAWRKADGDSVGLRSLPKELIRTIIEFLYEQPLVYKFAMALANNSSSNSIDYRGITADWFERNKWSVKFFYENRTKWTPQAVMIANRALGKLKSRFFREHITEFPWWYFKRRLWNVVFKYGTPTVEHLSRAKSIASELSIESLKAQNRPALQFMIEKEIFVMPSVQQFTASIKPKHNITYEGALELIKEIKQHIEQRKNDDQS
jgi:hypothetical protein